ncbi:hypothetical protein V8C86DRAFT_3026932 [Haematococcus lacustris]
MRGLRDAVTTALSQQQGAGDVYAAQLEQAAGVINGFTTPLQFGTLGTVRNYITRVIQVNTLLGSIQRYLTPTSQLAAQRLLFDGIRLSINFVTSKPSTTALARVVSSPTSPPTAPAAATPDLAPGLLVSPHPPHRPHKRLLEAGSEALEPLTQSSNPLEELAAQLAASGMTSRDLLAVGPLGGNLAGIAEEAMGWGQDWLQGRVGEQPMVPLPAAGPTCLLALPRPYCWLGHLLQPSPEALIAAGSAPWSSLFTTVGSVEDVVQALLARVTPLIDSDSFDFRQALTPSGDFLTNAASVVRNATSQLEATVQRLGGAVFNVLFQPPITNVSRVNIGNWIQSILQAIGDNIAVIPAAIALITGPILFELASVDYYNLLVAAFPGVPNGYLTDLNTALGGIGARLTNPNNVFLGGTGVGGSTTSLGSALGSLRGATTQLGGLRAQLGTAPRASFST